MTDELYAKIALNIFYYISIISIIIAVRPSSKDWKECLFEGIVTFIFGTVLAVFWAVLLIVIPTSILMVPVVILDKHYTKKRAKRLIEREIEKRIN